jgi:hypothetical protein
MHTSEREMKEGSPLQTRPPKPSQSVWGEMMGMTSRLWRRKPVSAMPFMT